MTPPLRSRVLVLWFPDWPLRAALGAPPHPPAAILHANAVQACTPSARAQGVRAGQRRREAQGLLPSLRLLPADPTRDERAFLPVLRTIEAQAPGVQLLRPGLAVLRARGVARYHGGEPEAALALLEQLRTEGYGEVRIGIADGAFTAELAARRSPAADPRLVVPEGASAAFLAPLPARVLPDPELVDLLARLGVHTLGDFAALDGIDVRDRFGERGARLHALARGADSRPLVARPPDPELAAETEFETPLSQSDQIAFAIRRTADAVALALAEASLVCTEIRIDLTDDDDGVHSRTWLHPTCFEASDLVDRVRWQLEALAADSGGRAGSGKPDGPGAAGEDTRLFRGIVRVRLAPTAVDDAAHHQPGLFGSGTDERLHHAVSRVQTLLGHDGVVTGAVVGGRRLADRQQLTPWGERVVLARDPEQPWPGSLPDPLPAEIFDPPRPITIADAAGLPLRVDERGLLSAAPALVDACPVRSWAGPWPVRDRRGEATSFRGERLQVVDERERAWLVLHTEGDWWAEGEVPLMGWHNPEMSWGELERTLSGKPSLHDTLTTDAPIRTHKRPPVSLGDIERPTDAVPYAELHAHSSYSFLDGASSPAELVAEAERLGLTALAITDHDGFYGAARLAEAAELTGVQTVFGAELSLGTGDRSPTPSRGGQADPLGDHLLVLARGEEGYHRLSAAISRAQLRGGEKGRPAYELEDLANAAGGHWTILTGCRKGGVRRGLETAGEDGARRGLRLLVDLFGPDRVAVELIDHGDPRDTRRNDALAALAAAHALPVVATNNVHYAVPERAGLAEAIAAVRATRSMRDLEGWLPAHGSAHLRSGAEMTARFARYPGAIAHGLEIAEACAFPLRRAKPALPTMRVPAGHTPMSHLRELVWAAVPQKYPDLTADGRARIDRELDVIAEKDFPGYFLIVHGIVAEARRRNILCQGRGSAAASAVCYLLGITAVDPILYGLPFERFLATTRSEEPDIDVDFDSRRREEIIQWVYDEYGRESAAQVANVIQYRPKNAVRDMARALGYSPGQQDAWSRQVERWGLELAPVDDHDIPEAVVDHAAALLTAPRHLGIHSGGMVLTRRPVGEVVPVEHARMEKRTVIQWDKDDAAWMGLVKFDLLGLGMLAALQHCFDLIAAATGETWTLESLPKEEPAVYDMLCRADTIGVFQVESRAQMGLLPRLQPREFYELAIQIALIRPGPIQGGAVHPFVRRKLGQDTVTYPHPLLEPVLKRTLGIPVFQEQLIQMATTLGDCTADEADTLRRAMGSKRGLERIDSIRQSLYAGMERHGLDPATADRIYAQIQAFSNFGFAESHSLSFALLVYASSWLKLHYPAAFLAGLLRSQPMGFYSAATLTADARRHGVEVRRPDLHRSGVTETLEPLDPDAPLPDAPTGMPGCPVFVRTAPPEEKPAAFDPTRPDDSAAHRRDGGFAVRLGLSGITGIGVKTAERIVAEREAHGPFHDLNDLVRRTDATAAQVEALATAGAVDALGLKRREAIWLAGSAAQDRARYLPDTAVAVQPPLFPDQTSHEILAADLWATGVSTDDHPMAHFRPALDDRGVLPSDRLRTHETERRIEVAGLVTHRQRPATAGGVTFLNLEDEHGLVNVVCSQGVWMRYRRVARESPALIVRGILERSPEGVVNVLADAFEDLRVGVTHRSRDFQ